MITLGGIERLRLHLGSLPKEETGERERGGIVGVGLVDLRDARCRMWDEIEIEECDGRRRTASLREAEVMDVAPTIEDPTAIVPHDVKRVDPQALTLLTR